MLANFGATSATAAALTLEQLGKNDDLPKALAAFADLENEVQRAEPYIAKLALEDAA
jgi:hypothetical protein